MGRLSVGTRQLSLDETAFDTSHASGSIDGRYDRQVRFSPVGLEGQRRLAASHAVVVGVGATGGVVAETLARAGVGRLTLIDRDYPELVNLQRQTLYSEADVAAGVPKAVAAAKRLRTVASVVAVDPVVAELHSGNARQLLDGADVIADGTDDFAVRFVLNDMALQLERPWVYCGAVGARGAAMAVGPVGKPCLRCLYPEPPDPSSVETCDTVGVLGPAATAAGAHAAMLAMRWLLGDDPKPRLFHLDVWHGEHDSFEVPVRGNCRGCGTGGLPALETADKVSADGELLTTTLCGRDSVHVRPPARRLDLDAVASRIGDDTEVVLVNEYLMRARARSEPLLEITLFEDGRAIVKGTGDEAVARRLYRLLVGTWPRRHGASR